MPQSEAQKEALQKARDARAAKRAQNGSDPVTSETEATVAAETAPAEDDDPINAFAKTLARQVTPGRAREEAQAARARASGSDPSQRRLEGLFADHLTAIADAFETEQRRSEEEQRHKSRAAVVGIGGPGAAANQPIPEHIGRGDIVLINQDVRLPDTFGIVVRLHPRVTVNGESRRWRADLVAFPLHGSPNVQEAVPFGPGVGQFREVPSDEDDIGVLGPDRVNVNDYEKPWESKL